MRRLRSTRSQSICTRALPSIRHPPEESSLPPERAISDIRPSRTTLLRRPVRTHRPSTPNQSRDPSSLVPRASTFIGTSSALCHLHLGPLTTSSPLLIVLSP